MSHKIIHPKGWAPAKGYANGVLTGDGTLYIGGQIGWTAEQRFEAFDFIGQMEQSLRNIVAVVEAAGGRAGDITRLTWYVTDKKEYLKNQARIGEIYRRVLGRHFPAMTMVVVSALIEDAALVEIEATAVIKDGASPPAIGADGMKGSTPASMGPSQGGGVQRHRSNAAHLPV